MWRNGVVNLAANLVFSKKGVYVFVCVLLVIRFFRSFLRGKWIPLSFFVRRFDKTKLRYSFYVRV